MQTTFLLGAGFSRAVSSAMPLTDQLGGLIAERVPDVSGRAPKGFHGGYFEAWLSRIAEAQPDLTESANAHNYALFLTIADVLHEVLIERELEALSGTPPWWLCKLAGMMHATRSSVVTFNYDTLIERTVENGGHGDWMISNEDEAKALDLVRNTPPYPPIAGWVLTPQTQTFRLLKLHGSLDSFWVPGDTSGATISRWYWPASWGAPMRADESERREYLPGRAPFIVPPAAAKSSFYNNPVSRELWRTAAEALSSAGRVAIIGYSIPTTDLVTSGMLRDCLAGRPVQVDVVNLRADEIAARLSDLGLSRDHIETFGGENAVAAYVEELERRLGAEAVQQAYSAVDPDRLLVVATSKKRAARVTALAKERDDIYLDIEPVDTIFSTSQKQHGRTQNVVRGEELMQAIDGSSSIRVRYQDGSWATAVGWAQWAQRIGLGDGRWAVLTPSAMPTP